MYKYTLRIDGMMCGMCEAHINDSIRAKFNVKKVNSSFNKGTCEIIAEELDDSQFKPVIDETGYKYLGFTKEPYEKKGLFGKFSKKS